MNKEIGVPWQKLSFHVSTVSLRSIVLTICTSYFQLCISPTQCIDVFQSKHTSLLKASKTRLFFVTDRHLLCAIGTEFFVGQFMAKIV